LPHRPFGKGWRFFFAATVPAGLLPLGVGDTRQVRAPCRERGRPRGANSRDVVACLPFVAADA
jgi:hypothetical protein